MSDRDKDKIKKGEGISKEVPRVDPGKSDTEKQAGLRVAEGNNANEITAKAVEELRARLRDLRKMEHVIIEQVSIEQVSKYNGLRVTYRKRKTPEPKKSGTRSMLKKNKIVMRRPKKNRIEG